MQADGSQDRAAQTLQLAASAPAPAPGSGSGAGSFAGLDFATFGDGWPPDPNGDVGPTYYIQIVNTSVGIFRKSDGTRVTAFSIDTLMSQGNFGNACDTQNLGDPVVVWDPGADRWIITDFAFTMSGNNPVAPYFQCFAVSRTADPVSGGWNFYALQTNDLFPDYPKLGVWPDALYLTANMFSGNTFKNVRSWALNKAQMYAGAATAQVVTFDLPAKVTGVTVFTGIPSTYHTVTGVPPAGRPNFISSIWSSKVARVWKFHVDWTNTANSTLTGPSNVTLATWGVAGTAVPAKNGNGLDTLRERLMVQSQYTNLGGVESLWLTHTVANPGNAALTSPRWYQLRVTGGTVVTSGPLQQSTWAPDSTIGRWLPSLAVDKNGSMAIGYSASSSTLFPAIRYAGRFFTDPLNTLGQTETSLIEGTASQCCNFSDGTVNNRWGDYSAMTIDPDGCTFWYTNEYYQSPQPVTLSGDNWQTQIGSFKFSNCTPNSATLQGTVTAVSTGNPISGATVTAGSNSTTTDGSGLFTLGSLTPATYTVTASAPGYTTGSASVTLTAGVTTTQNFALVAGGPATTTLAVAAASGTYGGTANLSATLTSSGTGVSGKSISFTLSGNSVGSASTDPSGIATLSNVSVSGIAPGTYPNAVSASFAGDASYASSSGMNSLTIAQASQTITFGALAGKTNGDPPFTVSATASSGLPVSFSASGNCTIASTTVTITGAGSCTITASQPGDANYAAAPNVPQTFSIAKASQTITFGALAGKTYGDPTFTVSATASSNLVVSFSASGNCTISTTTVTITGAGSCTITASQAGDSNYAAAPTVPQTFSIAKASQTITFGGLAGKTYGDPAFAVSATASSGLVVSFSASNNCTVAGTTVTITGAGSCTITASQSGNTNYSAAPNVPQTFSIAQASQTITFGALAGKTYGDPAFAVSATASSGLVVSFSASGNCTVAGTTVTITGAGSCTITASQAGNVNYTAAVNVPQTFAIAKASQTITFNPLPDKATSDPPFTVSATASSGLVVSFSASGNCTIAGTTVTLTGAGSCTITASQAGNANYTAAANVPQTFSIGKASQTITFGALAAKTYGDPAFTVSATASSGLTVSFSASGNCTIAVTTVTITGAGSCTITASQPGDANYAAAPNVPQTFSIAKASQTITFGALASKTYGDPTFTVGATASSNLVVSFGASGNCTIATTTVTITGAGSCTITASQAGDSNYAAAPNVPQTFSIAQAGQTITFGGLAGRTYGDPAFTVSATASSGLAVSFSASGNCTIAATTVTITGAGSCTVTASQAGNLNYTAAPNVPQTFAIAKANQTITFNALANKTTSDPPFTVSATASSTLPVALAASGNCTVSGNTVTITGAGSCTITASQAGDSNYNAAQSVPQSFTITTATGGPSPDGTTVPPAPQIVDSVGGIWTIGANQVILLNGVQAGGGFGSQILWKNTTIFVLGTDNNFWQWTGSGWVFVGPVPPGGGGTASADGTLVPPATQIVDNFGSVWTIGSGQVILRNGVQAAGGFGSEILWKNATIYVLGTGGAWYQWTGAGWTNVGPVQP